MLLFIQVVLGMACLQVFCMLCKNSTAVIHTKLFCYLVFIVVSLPCLPLTQSAGQTGLGFPSFCFGLPRIQDCSFGLPEVTQVFLFLGYHGECWNDMGVKMSFQSFSQILSIDVQQWNCQIIWQNFTFVFGGTPTVFSIMSILIYTSDNTTKFGFLHVFLLASTCYLFFFS